MCCQCDGAVLPCGQHTVLGRSRSCREGAKEKEHEGGALGSWVKPLCVCRVQCRRDGANVAVNVGGGGVHNPKCSLRGLLTHVHHVAGAQASLAAKPWHAAPISSHSVVVLAVCPQPTCCSSP